MHENFGLFERLIRFKRQLCIMSFFWGGGSPARWTGNLENLRVATSENSRPPARVVTLRTRWLNIYIYIYRGRYDLILFR